VSKILILGGGVIGLSTAMMVARKGHSVTILEHDNEPLPASPEEAWRAWERRGVSQFRLPHFLHPPVRHLLESHLPEVKEALLCADCLTFDVLATIPPSLTDRTPREGDERFITITGRRPTIEYAFASVAEKTIPVRRGVAVGGLLTGPSRAKGIPHVRGVRTVDGEEFSADLIIDAMGRGSKLPRWLESTGARPSIEEVETSGFVYYTRYFRSTTATVPRCHAALQTYFQSFSLLTLPGDAGTWSVTVVITSKDQPLKKLRDPN
jgi:2-polyprenyl-6-methoxyphenol hydroxylase-like FAD-dependent oxidoreductase